MLKRYEEKSVTINYHVQDFDLIIITTVAEHSKYS